jgi:type II secretory pathway component PulF
MKKLVVISALLLTFLMIFLVPIFAEAAETPGSALQTIIQFRFAIGSFPGTMILLFFLVPTVIGIANVEKKQSKYLTMLGVTLGITIFARVLPFGFLHGLDIISFLLSYGMVAGFQVGLFSWKYTKEIQEGIQEKWKSINLFNKRQPE